MKDPLTASFVTIADLAAQEILFWCRCSHLTELDAGKLWLRPSTPVPRIEDQFWCDHCHRQHPSSMKHEASGTHLI
jgi:hypothetical protein